MDYFKSIVEAEERLSKASNRYSCTECGKINSFEGVCDECEEAKKPSTEELHAAYREMEKLTDYILRRFPDEPGEDGRNESAADVAIRLMKQVRR